MGIENCLKQLRLFKRIDLPFTMHTNQTFQVSAPLVGIQQNVLFIVRLSTADAAEFSGLAQDFYTAKLQCSGTR